MSELLLFLLGIHLMMVTLAAGYRLIDLRYRLRDFLLPVIARILLCLAAVAAVLALTGGSDRWAFIAGMAAFAVFHGLLFYTLRAVVAWRARKRPSVRF